MLGSPGTTSHVSRQPLALRETLIFGTQSGAPMRVDRVDPLQTTAVRALFFYLLFLFAPGAELSPSSPSPQSLCLLRAAPIPVRIALPPGPRPSGPSAPGQVVGVHIQIAVECCSVAEHRRLRKGPRARVVVRCAPSNVARV